MGALAGRTPAASSGEAGPAGPLKNMIGNDPETDGAPGGRSSAR